MLTEVSSRSTNSSRPGLDHEELQKLKEGVRWAQSYRSGDSFPYLGHTKGRDYNFASTDHTENVWLVSCLFCLLLSSVACGAKIVWASPDARLKDQIVVVTQQDVPCYSVCI